MLQLDVVINNAVNGTIVCKECGRMGTRARCVTIFATIGLR